MNTINAEANPAQAQQMLTDVMSIINEPVQETQNEVAVPEISDPLEPVVNLPGGYATFSGEVITTAEVRELTGRDEEAISKIASTDKLIQEVLTRGTVSIGSEKATEEILNNLLSGDRDYLLLKIFQATFGSTLEATPYCVGCGDASPVQIDLDKDVPIRTLKSPSDRRFSVKITRGEAKCELPTGHTQRLLVAAIGKNVSELSTILLSNTVTEIRGVDVLAPSQVLDLSIKDRRKLGDEILKRVPGPQFQETQTKCPTCETTLEVPLSIANLFRF